jgi:Transposase, Mutator family
VETPNNRERPSNARESATMKEVDAALLGAYLSGVNSRRLRGALSPLLRGAPLSKDAVSRLVGRLRDEFTTWSTRDLAGEEVCYLFLDDWYSPVRIRLLGRLMVGSPQGMAPPRLRRIRTCGFPASGSSVHGFAT